MILTEGQLFKARHMTNVKMITTGWIYSGAVDVTVMLSM
jgi:hypothetical protein